MTDTAPNTHLSAELNDFVTALETEETTIGAILDLIADRGFGLILLILALPAALPLPAPGYATPFGIMELLRRNEVDTQGKHTVIIGRSHIVGRPMSILMSRKGNPGNSTVTLTHSRTKNIEAYIKAADIVISALGVPEFVKADMVKEGAVVIDVGITRVPDESHPKGYVIKGDVDFEGVSAKASHITPVPGGVGPMTIAMLLQNTLLARARKA